MRIIGGNFKGKKIAFVKSKSTRPLRDIVKENIFNILNHSNIIDFNIKSAKVLDLYSGVGSFGIECISRGANYTVFVEKNKETSTVLEKNLCDLKIDNNKFYITNNEVNWYVQNNKAKKFNIFFLDPPYSDQLYPETLKVVKESKMFLNKNLVIIHRESGSKEDVSSIINILKVKNYGRSKIIFGTFLN
jgi:16S rRNA (guanine966-N2)-methyltransferase